MSAVVSKKKPERQSAIQAPARRSGDGRNPPTSSFRTPHSGDPESSFSVSLETVAFAPLGEVADINPRFDRDELTDNMLVSFVPMKCVEEESGRFLPLEDRKVGEVRKGYTSFRDGDVIFAKVTPCMENGKAAVVSGLTNGVGFGSTEFFVLRPSGRIDPKYLLHFVLQQSFRKEAARNMTGAVGLRRVPKSWLEQQRIPLPSIAAQRQIVAEIEKQFTRLDAGVAALRRVQANLKRYHAAVLKVACEGRLVPTEAELAKADGRTCETGEQLLARILADRRKNWHGRGKYKEPAAPDAANLPPLPAGWKWASCAKIGEAITGFTPPKSNPEFFGGDVPFFKPTDLDAGYNVREFRDSLTEEGAQRGRILPPMSILVTCIGATIGKAGLARVRCTTNQQINALVVPDTFVSPKYVYWYFLGPFGQRQVLGNASATTLPILNKSRFEALPIPLPPLVEQTRIVAEVERRLSVIEELEVAVAANFQRATRLRQSILRRALE